MPRAPASLRLSALSGILSPVVLAIATTFVAAHRPEYSHVRDAISELGAVGRPYASLMNFAGIIPAGVLTILAAPAIYSVFGKSRLSLAGEIVLALAGVGFIGTALFAWIGTPTDLTSANNKFHLAFAFSGFFFLALAPFLLGLHARWHAQDRTRSLLSIATGLSVFVFGFLLPRPPYLGIFQRAALTVFFVWLIAISLQSLRSRRRSDMGVG